MSPWEGTDNCQAWREAERGVKGPQKNISFPRIVICDQIASADGAFCMCKWDHPSNYYMAIRVKLHSCCLLSVSLINPVIRQLMKLVWWENQCLGRGRPACVSIHGLAWETLRFPHWLLYILNQKPAFAGGHPDLQQGFCPHVGFHIREHIQDQFQLYSKLLANLTIKISYLAFLLFKCTFFQPPLRTL